MSSRECPASMDTSLSHRDRALRGREGQDGPGGIHGQRHSDAVLPGEEGGAGGSHREPAAVSVHGDARGRGRGGDEGEEVMGGCPRGSPASLAHLTHPFVLVEESVFQGHHQSFNTLFIVHHCGHRWGRHQATGPPRATGGRGLWRGCLAMCRP